MHPLGLTTVRQSNGGEGPQRYATTRPDAPLSALGAPLLGMDVLGQLQFNQQAGVLKLQAPAR